MPTLIKKPIFIIPILSIVILLLMFGFLKSHKKQVITDTIIPFTISGTTYQLLLADTEPEWERGLMFVTESDGFDGMLFEFGEAKPRTFWNKNTYVDIDLYWFAGDELVGKNQMPSIKKSGSIVYFSSRKPVDKVVEIIK